MRRLREKGRVPRATPEKEYPPARVVRKAMCKRWWEGEQREGLPERCFGHTALVMSSGVKRA